ncbi:MAG: peptidase [Acidobacteria bacterium]|nr:peptidase [Acidobacteriota bacterium]
MGRIQIFAACATLVMLLGISISAQETGVREISFTVSMTKPHTHLFEVEVSIRHASNDAPLQETLVMPVWQPGSYLVREFERQVQDFAATDAAGHPLAWEKINKNSWRINSAGAGEWRATYRVYANELSVRTSELNSDHAFWNNTNLLMYLDGHLKDPATLKVNAPAGWQVATGLPQVPNQSHTFRADNFDVLYDSPVEVSDFKVLSFTVKGVPHRIVIDGAGNYDPERMRVDVQKIVATEVELMGGEIPYHDYTFILHLRSNAGGGLEHLNSTALGYPRFGFKIKPTTESTSAAPFAGQQSERDYAGFLSLVAHEFFHLWNVKRIRPDALGPFDYNKENYTKLLWVAEGITDYYSEIALRRAGLVSEKDFLAARAKAIQDLQETPGRLVQSVEESSFDAWIKYYRQDENSLNSQISYYDKGAILGLLLDLEIRKKSAGAKSLDDVMRYLYAEFFKKNRNYTPQDFQKACELMAGAGLDRFFARYVRGREELDYEAALNAAGLRLDISGESDHAQQQSGPEYFGAELIQQGERLLVTKVYAGSPAYEQGLNAGDQIVALDNMRVSKEFLLARLAEKKSGDAVRLAIFRFDDLRLLEIKLGTRKTGKYRIIPVSQPTDGQRKIYEAWLKAHSKQ